MGSQRKMNSAMLLAPLAPLAMAAAMTTEGAPAQSWYSVKALSPTHVEIQLYDEIGAWGITAKSFAQDLKDAGGMNASRVDVRIHSYGGDVMDGFVIYNLLRGLPGAVHVYIDGVAASMASVIAMAGTVHMPENAWIMIHKPWGGQVGDEDDLREYADFLARNEKNLVAAYTRKTGKGEDEIRAMLKPPTWMNGQEALSAGFADHLLEPLQAAAQLVSQRFKEFPDMPKALQALMQPRASTPTGAAPTPTPTPTPTPAAPAPQPAAPVAADEAAVRAQIQAAENTRREGIRAVFQPFAASHGEMLNEALLDSSMTVENAQAKLLASLATGATPSAGPSGTQGANAYIHSGNGNLVGDSVRASILARAGYEELQADNRYNHMGLIELARASLVDRGVGVASQNRVQMVGLAFTHTTSDFGTILIDVANRSLLAGWEEAEETFQLWTKKGFLSDFKTMHRIGMGEFPALREVREGAEYKYVTVGGRSQPIALATYGELFSITRQVIINDDMSMLTDIPRKMGLAAKGTIGDLVYAVLTKNAALADGKTLFHADHKNLQTGAGSALSLESLSKGKTQMATQRGHKDGEDGKGRPLNIRPAFVLTPVALEDKAKQIIKSASVPGAESNSGIENPIRNFAEVIGEPRLDDASATAWYMAARQGSDTIEVAYLDGNELPYMEQQQGFTVDGVATKVRIDAGVAPLDFRGLQKSAGA